MSIYKIKCLTTDDFYIGSTNNFTRRRYEHRTRFNCNTRNCNDKLYDFMRINGGLDNFEFIILKEYEGLTKKELNIEEQKYINELKPTLNAIKSYNTPEDIRLRACRQTALYRERYPEKTKEECRIRSKKRYKCECGKEVSLQHKARHKRSDYHIKSVS